MVTTQSVAWCYRCKGSHSQSQSQTGTSQHLSFNSLNVMYTVHVVTKAIIIVLVYLEIIPILETNLIVGGLLDNMMLIILLVMNEAARDFLVKRWDTWWKDWEGVPLERRLQTRMNLQCMRWRKLQWRERL